MSETLQQLFQFLTPGEAASMPNHCCNESQQCCAAVVRRGRERRGEEGKEGLT